MNVGEKYIGLKGPFKDLIFTVIARDDTKCFTTIKTILYDKVFEISDEFRREEMGEILLL